MLIQAVALYQSPTVGLHCDTLTLAVCGEGVAYLACTFNYVAVAAGRSEGLRCTIRFCTVFVDVACKTGRGSCD